MMLAAGEQLGPYQIVAHIGAGGMGEVYRAKDSRLERDVAIKVLPQHLSENEQALKRFEREAKSLAALSHPNILTIYDIGKHNGQTFVVMELLEGETLRQRIQHSQLSWQKAIQIISAVAQGLSAAHSRGIIHRDLKPENIFITSDDRLKILDFGIAKRFTSQELQSCSDVETESLITGGATVLGTVPYMSPEQVRGENLDAKSDIFSTGTILYELLTGHRPFDGPNITAVIHKIINEHPQPPSLTQSEIPKWVDGIIKHTLAKEKEKRYSTEELVADLKKYETSREARLQALRRPVVAIPVIVALIVLGFLANWYFNRQAKIRWARQEALPQIEQKVEESWRDSTQAYKLAEEAEKIIPNDPKLNELFSKISLRINVNTEPPAAKIFIQDYKLPNSEWKFLGVSPLKNIRVPIGVFRWRMEKEGYETILAASSTFDVDIQKVSIGPYNITRVLDKKNSGPEGMVRVSGTTTQIGQLNDFYIDRYEVTNAQYKKFLDSGGYQEKKYWKQEFLQDGKIVSWHEAISKFVDQTERPGPSSWSAGDYLEGQDQYPVSGVSWYEAAAFAEFTGKSLPTTTHWGIARGEATPLIQWPQLGGFAVFAPFSNFLGKSSVSVGSLNGITAYGAYDMAGNVREWCWNETPQGRLIRGGAWGDNIYMFNDISQAPAMDRSVKNGFRCAFYPDAVKIPKSFFVKIIPDRIIHSPNDKPVSDSVFQIYKERFSYDKTPLNARVESRKERPDGWILERITFDAAYGNERVIACLFLPKNARPPYQTVIYFPGSASLMMESSMDIENYYEFPIFLSFIVKNGRAVLYPIYIGTFERRNDAYTVLVAQGDDSSHLYAQHVNQLGKDFRRSIDYLETRTDIDSKKIAYYGMSWGGQLGSIIPAVEERLQAIVLLSGGLDRGQRGPMRPEADPLNYVTHIRIPTLMLNGRYDTIFPYETSIKPLFDLLGTPKEDKVLKLYDTDHIPPRNEFVKETLAWLDRYLGTVN